MSNREKLDKNDVRFLRNLVDKSVDLETLRILDVSSQKRPFSSKRKGKERRGPGKWSVTNSGRTVVQIFKRVSFWKIGEWKNNRGSRPNIIIAEMEAVNNRFEPYLKITIWSNRGARDLKELARILNKMDNIQYHPFRSIEDRSCWRVTLKGDHFFLRAPTDYGGTNISREDLLSIILEIL